MTELPYLVGPEKVIEKIKDGVNSKKLQGISDVTDLTDRNHGLRLVIEIKTGFDPQVVLDLLYRFTPMEDSFSINNVALVAGRPLTLGLKDLLGQYLAHRILVTRRRSENRLGKKQARLHLIEGLLIAIVSIDEVIQVIRTSEEVDQARSRLMQIFDLSEIQAEYILELRLRRLTKFSKIELENEKSQLLGEIAELERILGSESVLRDLVSDELAAVAAKYGDERRTTLLDADAEVKPISNAKAASISAELADTPCVVVLTATGLLGRIEAGVGAVAGGKRKRHDVLRTLLETTTRKDLGFVTSAGRMLRIHAGDVPPSGSLFDAGNAVKARDFLGLAKNELVVDMVSLDDDTPLAIGTASGVVKRVVADWPLKPEFEIIALKDGDTVIGAAPASDSTELVFIANDSQLLHYSASLVRPQGRAGSGMAGIGLDQAAKAIYFGVVHNSEDAVVLTVADSSDALKGTDPGSAKISDFSEFPAKGRATGGVRSHRFIRNENQLYTACVVEGEVYATAVDGKPVELPETKGKRDGSGSPLANLVAGAGTLL